MGRWAIHRYWSNIANQLQLKKKKNESFATGKQVCRDLDTCARSGHFHKEKSAVVNATNKETDRDAKRKGISHRHIAASARMTYPASFLPRRSDVPAGGPLPSPRAERHTSCSQRGGRRLEGTSKHD